MDKNSEGSDVDENSKSAARGRVNPNENSDSAAGERVSPSGADQRDPSDSSEEDGADESSKNLSEEAKKEEQPTAPTSFKPLASHSRKSLLSTLTRHVHIQFCNVYGYIHRGAPQLIKYALFIGRDSKLHWKPRR